ncbi:capsid assembly protein [Rhizobium leguminosarum]|uniref:capsid assembly protein n=1 Tax=Rhizobium leguminosarum TaxID=384 RepID=UPI001C959B70|nr:hypothetical protein [Rhizobium leguminosarum]MBY5581848.1 hypothetical protein [Rhizobium leguminosarum]
MIESVTVGAASTPTEEEALAALTVEAESAPATTEEALAALEASKAVPKLPEKFKSTEDLLKAYQELERKLGAGQSEEVAEVETEVTEEVAGDDAAEDELPEDLEVTEDDVEEAAEDEAKEGEDEEPLTGAEVVEYLTDRFSEQDGKLTDDDYALAEEMGYDRAMVDGYIAGQQAAAELATIKMHEAAGGEEALNSMLVWASTGLKPAEIEAYNAALADNDVSKATDGVAKLRAAYEAANGVEPKVLLGGKPARTEASVFTSWAEVTAAMSDPRYGTKDAAYTASVAAKLARSSI